MWLRLRLRLNPVKYVEHLLTEIPKRTASDTLEDLMPWVVRLGGNYWTLTNNKEKGALHPASPFAPAWVSNHPNCHGILPNP